MPCVGKPAVFVNSVKQVGFTQNYEEDILYYNITPQAWDINKSTNPQGEFSYGILQLLSDDYPGQKVEDTEHGKLNLVSLA